MIKKIAKKYQDLIPIYVVMLIMICLNAFSQQNFFSGATLTRLVKQLSPYVFISMAQMCVMIIGGMDFGLGALVSLSTCLFATNLLHGLAGNIFAIVVIIVFCGAIDALIGLTISKFNLPTIVVTLATSFVFQGLALYVLPTAGGEIPSNIAYTLVSTAAGIPVPLILMAAFLGIWYIVRRSSAGLLIFAVGDNKKAAFSSGLNVHKAYAISFFLSGVFAAMSGLMLSAITMSGDPTIASDMTINSVTAAVLGGVTFSGGRGKMSGAVAGAVVVGMLVNVLFYLNITGFYTYVVQGAILLLAVAMNNRRKKGSLE